MFRYDPRKPKWSQIVEEIRRRIDAGEYDAETLLSEVAMEEEFQVSRPTVRKAMKVLRDQGWIVTSQGVGSFPTTAEERAANPSTSQ